MTGRGDRERGPEQPTRPLPRPPDQPPPEHPVFPRAAPPASTAQAGQNYGYSLLWVLLLLVPVLIVNQEMVVRLGAVTGVGHARLINERFGKFWGWFSVGDLFLLNFLTIVTEFIGISLAMSYFGVSQYISVPIAALTLVAITT